MTRSAGPTIRRWQLGSELRRHREAAGIKIAAAAREIDVTAATMSKMEGGKQAIKSLYIRVLAPLYGLEEEERGRLLALAEEANQPGWWVTYGRLVPDWFRLFLGYEADASELRTYHGELVPGQLQTAAYARAVALANRPESTDEQLDRQVELRRARQQRLTDEGAPILHAVLNEAVLLRAVGGPEVMREQLLRLVELAQLPHVTIQVLPFSTGAHPAMTAPFLMLGFDAEPRMNCVYLENGRGSLYLEKTPDLERYHAIFAQLCAQALEPGASAERLVTVAGNL